MGSSDRLRLGTKWSCQGVRSDRIENADRTHGCTRATSSTSDVYFCAHSSVLGPWTSPSFREPTLGLGRYLRCQSKGRRRSAWDLWMKPLMHGASASKWIEVLSDASVQRIVYSGERVSGIVLSNSQSPRNESYVAARKGVVVCAGAIQSPKLLLTSGIGDSDDLANLDIECRADSPNVGKNFQDHLVFPVVYSVPQHKSIAYPTSVAERLQYAKHRTGPRASNIAEAGGFFPLPSKTKPNERQGSGCDFQWHITPTHYLEYPNKQEPTNAMSIAVCLSRPASRGSVRLRNANQSDSPARYDLEIRPEFLTTSSDVDEFIEAIQWTRSIGQSGALSELFHSELMPGTKRQSREQLVSSIKRFATTLYHYAGTCAMGQSSSSVLDSRFRVHGVEGLWVCDASSMPSLVSGNTQATVMMMAYRLADWLSE